MKSSNRTLSDESRNFMGSLLGILLYAVGINMFVVPANLYTGGLLGGCQVLRTLLLEYLHLPISSFDIAGIIYYIINIPIMIVAMNKLGRKFLVKTLFAVTSMTLFLAVIPVVPIVEDTMTACVVGGILSGAGVGVTLRMGASVGGIDVVGVLITRWKRDFSVGKMNLLVNLLLYGTCFFLFNVEIVVYSLIYAAVNSIAMDKIHIQNINVEVHIITKADTQILEREVFEVLGRGITKWTSCGAYTNQESHVLYVILSKYELVHLKSILHKYDPAAFIVVNEGVSVDGNYLKKL